MAQAASKSCEICDGGPGRHYCQQCDQLFCVNCKTSHLRTKISKNHTFFSGLSINEEEKPFCSEHDELFIFHCIDCDTAVCQICAVKKHNRHNMLGIEESVQTLKEQIQLCVEFQVEHLRNNITQVEQGTTEYQSEIEAASQSIAEDAKRLKDLIDQKAKDLIKSVKENGEINLEFLSTANSEFNNTLERFNVVQRAIVNTANMLDVAVLPKLKQFEEEMKTIEIKDVPGIPEIEYSKKDISGTDIRNFFGELTFRQPFVGGNGNLFGARLGGGNRQKTKKNTSGTDPGVNNGNGYCHSNKYRQKKTKKRRLGKTLVSAIGLTLITAIWLTLVSPLGVTLVTAMEMGNKRPRKKPSGWYDHGDRPRKADGDWQWWN